MNYFGSRYPWYAKFIFWLQKKKYGEVLNSALIWGKSPKIFLALSCFYAIIDRKGSLISPVLRSLIIVRVSQINNCAFCIDLNSSILLKREQDTEKVQALSHWQSSNLFSEKEKLILEYTEAVTNSKQKISATLRSRIKKAFKENEIVELTAIIAFQNMSTKFNNAFDIEPQSFCTLETKII
jgi:uncharacterized peroxidase-related enzyme